MMRVLFVACVLLTTLSARSQCTEPSHNKVLLVGDSWAFFMGVDQTIDEVLARWGHSGYRYLTNLEIAENGAETDDFLEPDKQAEIADRLLSDPEITVVHLSIGGNDVLGDWHVSFSEARTDSLEQAVFQRLQQVVNFILGVRPDVHILWSGYMYPNFEEVIEDIAPLQTIHPFYGTWEDMGFPSFIQLNTLLNDFSAIVQAYTDTMERVSFVNATALMQHTFGQGEPLGVAPGGSYPPEEAPLPFGHVDYPSPMASMRDYGLTRDCFHLSPAGYRDMLDLHARKFYHKFLMDDQYLLSSGSNDGTITGGGTISPTLHLGSTEGEAHALVLTFPTSTMTSAWVGGASIFLRRDALAGEDPIGSTVDVKVKSGAFGTTFALEAEDLTDAPDASVTACRFGSTGSNGDWIRIDLPLEALPYLRQTGDTQFILSIPSAADGSVTYHDASDPELAPVLNLRFTDIITTTDQVPVHPNGTAFPNPTTGLIDLALPAEAMVLEVQVLDLTGRLLLHHTDDVRALDLSTLPTGQYVLHIRTNTGKTSQRVVKW
ncbi:MAG: T9SS type A sorting domain-containing protein [Flavobacteriales bacterium]|nr:T9SS type A sorting domain-containing protein [Flavobacteriales bacterium]